MLLNFDTNKIANVSDYILLGLLSCEHSDNSNLQVGHFECL